MAVPFVESSLQQAPAELICFRVIAGLDHGLTRQSIFFAKKMDPRVKPAGDGQVESSRPGHALR
jgi:hypothetical protein